MISQKQSRRIFSCFNLLSSCADSKIKCCIRKQQLDLVFSVYPSVKPSTTCGVHLQGRDNTEVFTQFKLLLSITYDVHNLRNGHNLSVFSNTGSAETDRNSQQQFYAVLAMPLFHNILATMSRIENCLSIALTYCCLCVTSHASFLNRGTAEPQASVRRYRCSKKFEKH